MYFFQFSISHELMLFITVIWAILGIAGGIIAVYYGVGSNWLLHSIKQMRKLGAGEPIVVGRNAVLNLEPVYVFGMWGSNVLMFVAFYEPELYHTGSVRLPRAILRWKYKHQIYDIEVARSEGFYEIPVGDNVYLKGKGILYALLIGGGIKMRFPLDFSRNQLNMIANELENEVRHFSSHTSILDEF